MSVIDDVVVDAVDDDDDDECDSNNENVYGIHATSNLGGGGVIKRQLQV